jgi:TonB family protein
MLDSEKRLIGKPQWAALSTGEAVVAGFPEQAVQAGVGATRVVLSCDVAKEGRLQACRIVEEPVRLGFGQAALVLGGMFRARPWTTKGLPTIGGGVRVPIRFGFPSEPSQASEGATR